MADEQLPMAPPTGAIANLLAGIPAHLVPRSLKALDRLIGAAVDIPVAWLQQQRAKIDSQTSAFKTVEAAIAKSVGEKASADAHIVEMATEALIRKAYRKDSNVKAVASHAIEELRANADDIAEPTDEGQPEVDLDWLNLFERYAEDASSERMQNLWGRILAGEIRRPGRFSLRTLRYVSEISQKEAALFASYSKFFVEKWAPKKLIIPAEKPDISDLLVLEENGLIQGVSGLGLSISRTAPAHGYILFTEQDKTLALKVNPSQELTFDVVILTDLGAQLIELLTDRDRIEIFSQVAEGYRSDNIKAAYIFPCKDGNAMLKPLKILWQEENNSTT